MELTKRHNKKNAPVSVKKYTERFFSFGAGSGVAAPFFQPKLIINTPGDVLEQQADAMAEQVMSIPAFTPVAKQTTSPSPVKKIQRNDDGPREEKQDTDTGGLTAVGENLRENNQLFPSFIKRKTTVVDRKVADIEKEDELQRKEVDEKDPLDLLPVPENNETVVSRKETGNTAEPTATQTVEHVLAAPGNSLEDEPRDFMEDRFQYDFSNVKIHDDSKAHQSASDIKAHAYTHQNHIVFGVGQYNPSSDEGKKLLAHELTHVVQQGAVRNEIQRSVILGSPFGNMPDIQPYESDSTNIAGLLQDCRSMATANSVTGLQHLLVFTQSGLSIFNLSNTRVLHQYTRREGSPLLPTGFYSIEGNGHRSYIVHHPPGVDVSQLGLRLPAPSTFSEETRALHGQNTGHLLDDYLMLQESDLIHEGYFPAMMVVAILPATGEGEAGIPQVTPWAQSQANLVTQTMGLGSRTGASGASGADATTAPDTPPSQRDTVADSRRPDRIVVWPRTDGKQFLNVWVGGRDGEHGGVAETVELHEGETTEDLQQRVEQATETARQELTRRAVNEENRITGGGVPYNEWTYRAGELGTGPRPNRPSYRATMSGPEVTVRDGTGSYGMSLHYEDVYPDLLGQVSAAFNGSDYVWQIIDITSLYQQVLQERGAAVQHQQEQLNRHEIPTPITPGTQDQEFTQTGNATPVGSMHTVGHFEADIRDLERRDRNFTEDIRQSAYDLAHPLSSQDGSSGAAVRSVLMNTFNLATIPLHAITTLGGWLVRAFSSIFNTDPAYEKEIPFPNRDGYYLVRCIAQPRVIGDGENALRRMPSVAVKVVEVKEIQARTAQEMTSQRQNLESVILELLLSYRLTPDEAQRLPIRQALEIKVQEAAQTHRSFLNTEIQNRRDNLQLRQHEREERGVTDADPVEDRIREEIAILSQGTAEGSGLISAIIANQIVVKQREMEQLSPGDIYRARDLRHQIEQLQHRLGTAQAREAEMSGGGQQIVRPEALFVNEEDGQTIPILIEIGQVGSHSHGFTMRLSDITGTSSDQYDSDGATRAAAVRHSIAEYAGHFPYGRGYLTVRFPEGNIDLNFGITEPITVRCNPRDTAQASERLDELLQILAIVGLFIPGVGLAVAAVGAALSAGRLLNRLNNHTFEWDTNTVMDVLNIVGAVAGGVRHIAGGRLVIAQRMFAIVPESEAFEQWVTRLSRFNRVVDFVDTSVNHVSYMLGMMETVNNFLEIQQGEASGSMTHAEARRRRAGLMAQAMYDQFMQHGQDMVDAYRGDGSRITHDEREGSTLPHDVPPPHDETRRTEVPDDTTGRPHEERSPHAGGGGAPSAPRPQFTGNPAERVRQFLGNRENVQALLRGEPHAFGELLQVHGNWRDLIMMLQGEAHNDMYQYLVDGLQTHRDQISADLAERFGLHLSDPNASTHPSSDIDLATTGTDAGARMTAAERYMREHYGANWSDQLRINFYTEAERLFMYEQVRPHMTEAAFSQLQGRITNLAEILNFAKMLQHATGNPESIARVEQLMTHLNADQQAQVRARAAETPADSAARAQQLHADVDHLAVRFEALRTSSGTTIPAAAIGPLSETIPAHLREAITRAVTPDELRVALASAISELQMEANFRTTEAYISPGAGRQVVREVAVSGHEAYQSALGHLEMMEHAIHQAGGNVETAAREYELYKYINRFIVAMQLAGIPANSFMLMYYQAAHDIYRNSRTSLQDVNRQDMGYLLAMHNHFVSEAAAVLPQMREAAMQNPSLWNSVPRSLEATGTTIRDTSAQPPSTVTPSAAAHATPSATGAVLTQLGTIGSLLGTGRGMVSIADVPILRNSALRENETLATYANGRLVLELGPNAGHEQIRQHLDTIRVLQRYEGTLGLIRRLFSQIGELLGMGPGFGSRGHEARQEVTKLLGIRANLEVRRLAIEAAMQRVSENGSLAVLQENYEALLSEISSIQSQVGTHQSEVNSTAVGRGSIGMASTTATGPVMTESNPAFRHEPEVGQSRRYRDRGGTEGIVSRLTQTTLAIITRLGQTTVRANYQSWVTPAQVGLPSGRHGFEALHAIGPGIGHESPYGIYFGPWRVNQLLQRIGIERFIGDVGSHVRSGKEILLRVEVEKVTMPVVQADGTVLQVDFLKSITYQLYGDSIRPGNSLFELSIEVARPNDPVSDIHFDPDSIHLSHSINDFTDMQQVSISFEPEFSATDPIDE